MKSKDNLRKFIWIEFVIWFIILCLCIWGYRYHRYKQLKQLPSYQIFMPDVDGMIVGSPVKLMGVQVGYVKNIKIIGNNVYVRFVITKENVVLPKGVVATVEFNGLGGSKSLELYPPNVNEHSDRLIVIQSPKRLHDSISLLNEMFDKIDSITLRFSHFASKMGVQDNLPEIESKNLIQNIEQTDNFVDNMIKNRNDFQDKLKEWKHE